MHMMKRVSVVALVLTLACGGSEFTATDVDASSGGVSGVVAATTSSSTSTATGGASGTAGGASGAGGSGGSGGSAGARDGGIDAHEGGGGGAGGGGGGPKNSGDCQSPSDCGGDACVEVFPGGYRVCAIRVPEATTCSVPPGSCCKSADCAADAKAPARCVLGPVEPRCAGPVIVATNVCASDACASAADCPGENAICALGGTLGRKAARCMTGGCRLDRDCTAEAGGICAPVANPCCDEIAGLFCVYPGGCRSNRDCASDEHCQTDATHAFCAPGGALCPR
jgi:hypothetical protein